MRIGGLTWWRNNYGSILQAYALQRHLRKKENVDYIIINQYSKKMASASNLIKQLKTVGLIKTVKKIIGRFGLKKLRDRVDSLQKFVDENLIVSENVYNEENFSEVNKEFDGFFCGSDQVWNPANVSLDSIYWLRFADKNKFKISYAPSIGISSASEEMSAEIKKSLESFDAISSREKSGTDLINKIMGEEVCKTVLDPTLMIDREIWDQISEKKIFDKPYIFTYILRGSKQERQAIEKFAKEKNLPVVTIPFLEVEKMVLYDFKFGDCKLWSASPEDFISAIRHAEYVFTDSFHCTVFSCLYHKKFFTFPKQGKNQQTRIAGLLDLLHIKSRMITATSSSEELEQLPDIDWETSDMLLSQSRNESQNYIKEALQNIKIKYNL